MMPEVISHYRIIDKIGAGGMGEVYLAQDTRLGRRVALKVLSAEFTNDDDRLRRFEQEARAASSLNHPNIITIYEVGSDNGTRFITTEYIEGETLRKRLARARMSLSEILEVSTQMAGALAAAHRAGIVHRDIKPENIMQRPDGYAKILDFGIVKLTESFIENNTNLNNSSEKTDETTLLLINTDSNIIIGSPSYMSPEQARGLKVDARTDIFSLGVVIYEMLTGIRPFAGGTPNDTIVAILNHNPPPLTQNAENVPEALERIVAKALQKDRENRYQTAEDLFADLRALRNRVEFETELERSGNDKPVLTIPVHQSTVELAGDSKELAAADTNSSLRLLTTSIQRHKFAAAAVLVLILAAAAGWFYSRKSEALSERDTVLIAEFSNSTGDPVFDGTLRQALAVQLEQSPFMNIFSDERVRETLRFMNRSTDERLTVPVAREICQRHGLKALLTGSIATLGSNYVMSLEAMNAFTGDAIAREQVEAATKEEVLRALGKAASKLRERLGESLPMIQKFDAPIEQATTSSLEALKAFALGNEQQNRARYLESIPFYRRAVDIDPNFALAYTRLAVAYDNSRQPELAADFAEKAFNLRGRVSERERLFIAWRYYSGATRELDKAIEVLELWKQTYARDTEPHNTLSFYYTQVGQFEKAIDEAREAIRLNPSRPQPYSNLGLALMCLNRFDEAKEVYEQALQQNMESTGLHWGLYLIALAQGNAPVSEQQVQWMSGRSNEYEALDWQAKTATFSGQFTKAAEFSKRAVEMADQGNLKEVASQFATRAVLREAVADNCRDARKNMQSALDLAKSNSSMVEGALALALCGDAAQAQSMIEEQSRRFPKDTLLNALWVPTVRALIELRRNNPAQAIQILQATGRYELGYAAGFWPMYIRGQCYLRQGAGAEAAAEFRKILDNRGIGVNTSLYSLAYLGLARAAALTGEVEKSRKAYEDFFAIWKDADAGLPLLEQARREQEKVRPQASRQRPETP